MTILFRYILRQFAIPAGLCLVGLSALFLLFTSFDLIGAMFDPKANVTAVMAFDFLAGTLSTYLEWLLPAVFLLATLYTMWQFCRHSELIAMRANGISMMTIVMPILIVAMLAAGLSFVNTEYYKPSAAARAMSIKESDFRLSGREALRGIGFVAPGRSHTWTIGSFNPADPTQMCDVKITFLRNEGSLDYTYEAPRANWLDGAWWLLDGVHITYYDELNTIIPPPKGAVALLPVKALYALTETPQQILAQNRNSELASAMDRKRNRKLRDRTGISKRQKYEDSYQTYNHYAAPLSILLVTLFAIPAGIASGRQSVFKGILLALSLFLAYYAITALAMMLANHAIFKPALAIMFPSFLFGSAAAILFWRQR
ncbi:MAG: LptF/LptG family permease [Kiritimatiellia bacterium]